MSIVGTRPPLISETNLYEPRHKARLAIKPGITGMWQVSGRSDITDFEEVVRLDKEYIENWDIGLFTSILQVLNLAELGVGSAMVYSMYKPIAENDKATICALLKLYKKYYFFIGLIIAWDYCKCNCTWTSCYGNAWT